MSMKLIHKKYLTLLSLTLVFSVDNAKIKAPKPKQQQQLQMQQVELPQAELPQVELPQEEISSFSAEELSQTRVLAYGVQYLSERFVGIKDTSGSITLFIGGGAGDDLDTINVRGTINLNTAGDASTVVGHVASAGKISLKSANTLDDAILLHHKATIDIGNDKNTLVVKTDGDLGKQVGGILVKTINDNATLTGGNITLETAVGATASAIAGKIVIKSPNTDLDAIKLEGNVIVTGTLTSASPVTYENLTARGTIKLGDPALSAVGEDFLYINATTEINTNNTVSNENIGATSIYNTRIGNTTGFLKFFGSQITSTTGTGALTTAGVNSVNFILNGSTVASTANNSFNVATAGNSATPGNLISLYSKSFVDTSDTVMKLEVDADAGVRAGNVLIKTTSDDLTNAGGNITLQTVAGGTVGALSGDIILNSAAKIKMLGIAAPTSGTVSNLVLDTATGIIYHTGSSARYKENIRSLTEVNEEGILSSEDIYKLDPCAFTYKSDEGKYLPEFGLIAEELHKKGIFKNAVKYNEKGECENIHYQTIFIALLYEFLKLKKDFDALKNEVHDISSK